MRYELSITERKGVEVMQAASVTSGFFVYLLASLGALPQDLVDKKLETLDKEGEVKIVGGFLGDVQYTFFAKEIKEPTTPTQKEDEYVTTLINAEMGTTIADKEAFNKEDLTSTLKTFFRMHDKTIESFFALLHSDREIHLAAYEWHQVPYSIHVKKKG